VRRSWRRCATAGPPATGPTARNGRPSGGPASAGRSGRRSPRRAGCLDRHREPRPAHRGAAGGPPNRYQLLVSWDQGAPPGRDPGRRPALLRGFWVSGQRAPAGVSSGRSRGRRTPRRPGRRRRTRTSRRASSVEHLGHLVDRDAEVLACCATSRAAVDTATSGADVERAHLGHVVRHRTPSGVVAVVTVSFSPAMPQHSQRCPSGQSSVLSRPTRRVTGPPRRAAHRPRYGPRRTYRSARAARLPTCAGRRPPRRRRGPSPWRRARAARRGRARRPR
jgi:hypothetical protein